MRCKSEFLKRSCIAYGAGVFKEYIKRKLGIKRSRKKKGKQ